MQAIHLVLLMNVRTKVTNTTTKTSGICSQLVLSGLTISEMEITCV